MIWALTPRPNSPTSSGSRSTIYRTLDGMRRNGDAGAAAADSDRQAGVAKGATLDVRSWMWDGLSLEQEDADFGVEACGLFHVRRMTGVGDDDEAGSVDAIAHLFTADEGRAGIIGAPDQERRNRYAAECFGEVGMHGARHRPEADRMEVPHD